MKVIYDKNLTKREKEILLHIISGKNKRDIAAVLSLSVSTIKANTERIYKKFNVHNKVELLMYLFKKKLVEIEDNE